MIALIDFDSILYQSVYRIVSFSQMRQAIWLYGKKGARQWLMAEIYNEGVNRCDNKVLEIIEHLNSVHFEPIVSTELFITTCGKSFRKELNPSYKANRKRNEYVWMLREHYRHNGAICHEELEADDLIASRAKEIGIGNYIIVSIDKDLKQIGGHYWSYYQHTVEEEKAYKNPYIEFIGPEKAKLLFWMQMLTGDPSDNIKGLHRVGEKTAEKILSKSNVPWIATAREYIKRNQKQDWKINYQLLKLG